jgi:hypothetical protein
MNYIYHNTYTVHTVQVQGKIFSQYDERDSVKKFVVFCCSHRAISPGPNIYICLETISNFIEESITKTKNFKNILLKSKSLLGMSIWTRKSRLIKKTFLTLFL